MAILPTSPLSLFLYIYVCVCECARKHRQGPTDEKSRTSSLEVSVDLPANRPAM